MTWTTQALRDASRAGDFGRVVKLAREAARVSQKQLGEACGVSQSAVSRLEARGTASYDMTLLARAAAHLQLPARMVGLAEHTAAQAVDGTDVERRNFLAGAAAAVAAPTLPTAPAAPAVDGQSAALRVATAAFRRMDGTTPSRLLSDAVGAHLRLVQSVAAEAESAAQRARLAAVGSEVASLAGWLAWDMGDYGSARTWYGTAIKAARRGGDRLLSAYQIGSLAQFEAHAGNAPQALSLVRTARGQLDPVPAIAAGWLATIEALAHAAAGDAEAANRALAEALRYAAETELEEPPWPWVFSFTEAKVAACRVSCGARLGLPEWVLGTQDDAGAQLASGHDKQRALLVLDIAAAHLADGRIDGAFSLATRALETGLRYRSGRIVERARALRRTYTPTSPARVVRDFDDRLHGVYL